MSKRAIGLIGVVTFLAGWVIGQTVPFVEAQATKAKAPTWLYGMNVKSRKFDETDFTDKTKKVGLEVFKDEHNGNLIYISESGSIAVVPGK